VAGTIIAVWQRDVPAALAIAASILGAMLTACLLGLMVPTAVRALRLDPKIASGPVTLALADVCTLLWYFGIASLLLTRSDPFSYSCSCSFSPPAAGARTALSSSAWTSAIRLSRPSTTRAGPQV
jgi:hypothetical protein